MVTVMNIRDMYCDKSELFFCSRCGSKKIVIESSYASKNIPRYLPKIFSLYTHRNHLQGGYRIICNSCGYTSMIFIM